MLYLVLTLGSKFILSPSSGKAGLEVKLLPRLRQADCVNMRIENKVLLGEKQGKVVVQISCIELWMDDHLLNPPVLVRSWLCGSLSVPLTTSHHQLAGQLPQPVHAVACCQEDAWLKKGSSALVHLAQFPFHQLLPQKSAHVRPLSKLGL